MVYTEIKKLREEFKKIEPDTVWSNVTMTIQNFKFRVEYDYEDLEKSNFTSYERHIIWRYKYLGVGPEQVNKKDREILNRYLIGAKTLGRKETYESGIYIRDIENIIGYHTDDYETKQNEDEINKQKRSKNQILLAEEEMKKMKNEKLGR